MSISTLPHAAPQGWRPVRSGAPAAMLGVLAAGLLALPGQARADSYGHAEISLGFPNGAVTVGRTWDEHPRQVVVEEVTHKYPEADDEAEVDEDDDAAYDDRSDDPDVVIEKHIVRPAPRHVTVIERYVEPEPCDHVRVIRRVYVDPPACERHVVYYGRPAYVVHGGPTVVVAHGGFGWRRHGGGYEGGRGWHTGYRDEGGSRNVGGPRDGGARNLFPAEGGRPVRMRGVGHSLVQVGAHPR
jgi:hypothetical protein